MEVRKGYYFNRIVLFDLATQSYPLSVVLHSTHGLVDNLTRYFETHILLTVYKIGCLLHQVGFELLNIQNPTVLSGSMSRLKLSSFLGT